MQTRAQWLLCMRCDLWEGFSEFAVHQGKDGSAFARVKLPFHIPLLEYIISGDWVRVWGRYTYWEILTKKICRNFQSQMSASQSEERTMLPWMIRPNNNRVRCFFTVKKNDASNQKPQRCVSFALTFPPFIGACSLQRRFADIRRGSCIRNLTRSLRSLVRFLISTRA